MLFQDFSNASCRRDGSSYEGPTRRLYAALKHSMRRTPSSAGPLCATGSNPGHATPDSYDWSRDISRGWPRDGRERGYQFGSFRFRQRYGIWRYPVKDRMLKWRFLDICSSCATSPGRPFSRWPNPQARENAALLNSWEILTSASASM